MLAVGLPSLVTFGALVTTDRYIVAEGAVISEDQYVTAMSGVVEGTIDGNLTIFAGDLTITGTVTGSVTVFSAGSVTLADGGSIGGSLNGSSFDLTVAGTVGSDVFYSAGSVVISETGTVQRDAITFAGTSRVHGSVARDVRGRSIRTTVDGDVDGDLDVAVQSLSVGPTAVIGGDILYRSAADADISPGATIDGTITKLPAQGNFLYGLILSVANVVGFLGFVVAGLVVFWLLRGTSARAVGVILTRPFASLGAGIVAVIALPLLIGLLAITLVGIPVAVVLLAIGVAAFIIGPVPAVTALGNRILVRRGGLFGALIVGAVVWRLGIWLIPYVGVVMYVLGLVWGIGGWVMGALAARRADPVPAALIPAAVLAADDDLTWEPPLAPGRTRDRGTGVVGEDAVDTVSPSDDGGEGPIDTPDPVEAPTFGPESAIAFGDSDGSVEGRDEAGAAGLPTGDTEDGARSSLSERLARLRDESASDESIEAPEELSDPSVHGESEREGGTDAGSDTSDDGWGLPNR
jgi:cytoskeletal protein CcmA (bactofilin family)